MNAKSPQHDTEALPSMPHASLVPHAVRAGQVNTFLAMMNTRQIGGQHVATECPRRPAPSDNGLFRAYTWNVNGLGTLVRTLRDTRVAFVTRIY